MTRNEIVTLMLAMLIIVAKVMTVTTSELVMKIPMMMSMVMIRVMRW